MEHTKEPWYQGNDWGECEIFGDDDVLIADCTCENTIANARRIVACVNACEGIKTEALEKDSVIGLLKNQERTMHQAEADRDKWKAMAVELGEVLKELAILMENTRDGDYVPDSFTTQPSIIALAKLKEMEEGK